MLSALKKWLATDQEATESLSDETLLHRAAAVLLFEIASVDQQEHPQELHFIQHSIATHFSLSEDTIASVIENARDEQSEATSLYQFTSLLNDNMSHGEKCDLAEAMWQVAFADGELDKYEEYMIRRICELLHLAHGDFIQAKLRAKSQLPQ